MWIWDYHLPKDWRPRTKRQWCWYLTRKINYGDFQGLKKVDLKKYFPFIQSQLDPGKRAMIDYFLKHG